MRNMSFSLTTEQVRNRTKDVTRRLGWKNLKPGEHFIAVVKALGLKKGERIVKICELECISNTPEPLKDIFFRPRRSGSRRTEVVREGFHEILPEEFVAMFVYHMHITPDTIVNRIEFKYVDVPE